MSRLTATLCLVLAMAFTGANVPAGKVLVAEMPVLALLVVRFAVATATLALLVRGEDSPGFGSLSGRDWVDLVVMALVGSILFMFFMLEGTKRTAAVDVGIITATIPAAVTLLGAVVRRRLPRPAEATTVALACLGLAIMQSGGAGGASSLAGNLLVAVAVICEAIFVLVSQRMSGRLKPIRLSLAVAGTSLLIVLPFAGPDLVATPWANLGWGTWAVAVWYALAASVFCTILWYRGAPRVEPWVAGLSTAALPITAVVVSALLLAEPLDTRRLLGGGLVVAAIVAGALSQRRPR